MTDDREVQPHRIAVVALPGVIPFELAIPARVFGAATDGEGRPLYDVATCSIDGGPVDTSADFAVAVAHGLDLLAASDTVVIAPSESWKGIGRPAPGEMRLSRSDVDTVAAALLSLRSLRSDVRICSICTAADVLAHAGLLDGRPATTHWRHADEFRALFPAVDLRPDVLYVDDGDVLTSAGAAAGVDLCLHVVRTDFGVDVANRAARACVVPPHRDGGQAQFVDQPVPNPAQSSTAATRAWALDRLDQPIDLAHLAGHAAMSTRTFTRRFRAEVGVSASRWLTHQRVALARRLLETTDLSVDEVAQRAGLGTAASLRLHMAATVGVSPTSYRRSFSSQRGR